MWMTRGGLLVKFQHIWVSYSPQSIQLVQIPCLTYHPLFSLVETPDGDQVAATRPSLFSNLLSLIEKHSQKKKGFAKPRLLFSSADILKKMT